MNRLAGALSIRRLAVVAGLAVVYALPFVTIPGIGAAYIKFDGIDGEAIDDQHKDWIDVLSFSCGVDRPTVDPTTGEPGRTKPRDVRVSKPIDKSTPLLFESCATGKVFPKVEIHVTAETPVGPVNYMGLTFSNVLVTSVSHMADTDPRGTEGSSEQVSFNFTKIEYWYTPLDKTTGDKGGKVEATWKVEEGES